MRWKQKTAVGWGVGVGSGGREWGGEWDSGKKICFPNKKDWCGFFAPSLFFPSFCLRWGCVTRKWKVLVQSFPTLFDPMDCSLPGSSCPRNSPGKNTGMGSHSFLQGIFLTQGPNLGLLHCRQILYCLSHQGSPQLGATALFFVCVCVSILFFIFFPIIFIS